MSKNKRVIELESSLKTCAAAQATSRGYKRVFFLTLFAALMLQALSFFYMQARQINEVLEGDFKIVLTLNANLTPARVNEIGEALSSNPDVLSLKFLSSEDAFALIQEQNPRLAENFVYLGRKPMSEYFELTVGDAVLKDIDAWIKDNISQQIPDVTPYYKSLAAQAAAYSHRLVKFLNLIIALSLVVLFSFVLFVEGYAAPATRGRVPAAVLALVSYAISLGVFWQLLAPLKAVGGNFFVFTILEIQFIIAFITGVLGWVLAKWKRF